MKYPINRRDFLKFSSLLPLMAIDWPSLASKASSSSQNQASPNVLVVVFDAFSAGNASLYGYTRATTPNLARIAEKAVVYHHHYSTANFTTPGTASLLTGTYPWTHRAIHLHGTIEKEVVQNNLFRQFSGKGYTRLVYSHNLLSTSLLYQFRPDLEVFKWPRELCLDDNQFSDRIFPRDYNTAFIGEKLMMPLDTDVSGSLFLSLIMGWLRGAEKRQIEERLKDLYPEGVAGQYGHYYLLETAIDWTIKTVAQLPQPFLAYIHLLPPHEPYLSRKDFVDLFADEWKPPRKPKAHFSQGYPQQYLNQHRRSYDEYIANVDAEFGRLYDSMAQNGLLENTYVIFTSDHGELFERGIQGHSTEVLYQPVIQVPLLIVNPGQTKREDVFVNTSSVDILPTLLHLAGINIPDWCEGEILPPFANTNPDNSRSLFCMEAKTNPKLAPFNKASFAVVKGDHKLMHYIGYDNDEVPDFEMFNLADDFEEMKNRYSKNDGVSQELKDILLDKINEANQRY